MTEKNEKPSLEQQVAAWSAERAEIVALAATAEGITIAGHADGPKAGREVVHNTLMPIWRRRCAIHNREKELLEIPKQITEQIKRTAQELSAPLLAAEDRLRKDRDTYDAEQERIKAEAKEAERLRVQARVEAMVSAGVAPDIQQATRLTDEQFVALIEEGKAEQIKRSRAVEVAQELTSLGDDCTDAEAYDLTTDQAEHRIAVARKAQHDREEAERLRIDAEEEAEAERKRIEAEAERKRIADQAEADRLERLRLEGVAQRVRDLSERGAARRFEEVEAMSDEEFAEAITEADKAVQAEADRKAEEARKIQEEREALERGSQRFRELSALGESSHTIGGLSAMGAEVYAEVLAGAKAAKAKRDEEDAQREREAQAKRDADRKAQEERDEQDRKEREQREREHVEALKPQRDAVIAWANSVIVPALPDIADEDLGEVAACAREDIGVILAKLIDRMGGTN